MYTHFSSLYISFCRSLCLFLAKMLTVVRVPLFLSFVHFNLSYKILLFRIRLPTTFAALLDNNILIITSDVGQKGEDTQKISLIS